MLCCSENTPVVIWKSSRRLAEGMQHEMEDGMHFREGGQTLYTVSRSQDSKHPPNEDL